MNRRKYMAIAHGKAFKISPITASRTVRLYVSRSFAQELRGSLLAARRGFSGSVSLISILRFSQASSSFGNRVPRPKRINVFKALSSRVSERHNTTSSSLNIIPFRMKLRITTGRHLQEETNLGSALMVAKKRSRPSPSPAGNGQS